MDGCQGGKNEKETKSIRIDLENLVCERSYDDLEITLARVHGIVDVDIDRKIKAAFIDYDPSVISEKQIIERITEVGCKIQEF
jgi:copper chaperone CopZ